MSFQIFLELKKSLIENKIILTQSDTVPALITRASNKSGIERIYEIKKRNKSSKIAIFVANLKMAKKFAIFNEREVDLFNNYLPGYYTLIMNANTNIPINKNLISIGENKIERIAIRMPQVYHLLKIIEEIDEPIIATSANISGQITPKNLKEVDIEISNSVDIILDLKIKELGKSSTIIDISNNTFQVIRD